LRTVEKQAYFEYNVYTCAFTSSKNMNHLYTIEKAIFYIGNSELMQLSKKIGSTIHVITEVVEAFKSTCSTHPIVSIVMLCYNGDL